MLRSALALLFGEALVVGGFWWVFPPSALIVLGVQIVLWALLRRTDAPA